MYTDPDEDLARTKRRDRIKTVILAVLAIAGGVIALNYVIGDPMEQAPPPQ